MPRPEAMLARAAAVALAVATVGWSHPPARRDGAARPARVYKSKTERAREAAAGASRGSGVVADKPGKLVYYGGRVLSDVVVVPVFWTSAVEATVKTQIAPFLGAIVASPYLDWLEEYDTLGLVGSADGLAGSNQHIGRGTATAPVTLTPMNTATSLSDADVQAELLAQLTAGTLPAPVKDAKGDARSLYVVEFPDGYSIDLEGHLNCSYYCGYHFTFTYEGLSVPYAVMPGLGACGGACGSGFDAVTSIHSHELVEAITDAEAGLAGGPSDARPLGWYDPTDNMEIADICDPFGPAPGVTGGTATVAGYTVQLLWSNYAAACVAAIPICDGSVAPPACRPCTAFDAGVGCTGASPVCQTSATAPNAGQCVGCAADADCRVPTPICDDVLYTCRACKASDCGGATPLCGTTGACVACDPTDTRACTGETPLCDATTGRCVGCVSGIDCPRSAPVCDARSQTCRACRQDADCVDGQVCDASKDAEEGRCVACNVTRDCTFGVCDARAHACSLPTSGDAGHGGDASPGPVARPSESGACACRASPPRAHGAPWAGVGALAACACLLGRRRGRRTPDVRHAARGFVGTHAAGRVSNAACPPLEPRSFPSR